MSVPSDNSVQEKGHPYLLILRLPGSGLLSGGDAEGYGSTPGYSRAYP